MTRFTKALFVGLVIVLAITATVGFGVQRAVHSVIVRDSIDKSKYWAVYMAERLSGSDIETILETGRPTQEQQELIRHVRTVGDIFRFKLFTNDGRLALESDDIAMAEAVGIAQIVDPEALSVLRTGQPVVDVFDGSQRADRPDLYAEAYVPLFDADGRILGVVEAYVDQTATRGYFMESFRSFGLMLMILCTIIFAVPCAGYVLQRGFAQRSILRADFLARCDALTGAMNRSEFVRQANDTWADGSLTALCFVDLDRFKTINDSSGHAVGDALLAHVSGILRDFSGPQDMIARFGGDEFVVAFHGLEMDEAVQKVRTILAACRAPVDFQTSQIMVTVSIGLTPICKTKPLEEVLGEAAAALYHVKETGRDNYAVYGAQMGEDLRQRQATERRLRDAVLTNDFEIHYQPLVDGATQELIGHEALLRLYHEDGTPIPPDAFIPIAEELGMIEDIGTWTIQTATKLMRARADPLVLAINLSPLQFCSGRLTQIVRDALEASDFPAAQLELEITETLLLNDSEDVEMQIDALKEMGVSIAMDDFGTGFSSLSYLWKYGFDRLKIDRSFVMALDQHPEKTREIIETIVLLGKRLKIKVTAEGVETEGQSALLSSLGCDVLQGYHFGRPSPLFAPSEHQSPAA